jgi:hypothetical protein
VELISAVNMVNKFIGDHTVGPESATDKMNDK